NQPTSRRLIPGASGHRGAGGGGGRIPIFGVSRGKPDNRLQQSKLIRCDSDCPSDMTDTYATVDYNGAVSGAPYTLSTSTRQNPTIRGNATVAGIQRNLYGQMAANVPHSSRSYQPLPVPPSTSTIEYSDADPSTAYGPAAMYDESGQCQQTSSYYYPSTGGTNILRSGGGFGNPVAPHHQIVVPYSSNQMKRRDARKQTSGRTNPRQLHARQLSEPNRDETVGLLTAAGGSSSSHPVDAYNSAMRGQIYTAGVRNVKNLANIPGSSGISAHETAGGGGGGGGVAVVSGGYQENASTSNEIQAPEENVYTSEFVLV
ncbi:unnamed protein product, partial [Trichobilharzia regenti]